ncbi:dTDP-glucose 4,6-dehydratase [Devosia sp. YIM 151766]|uniref:dTDP-glucose 4,6-dehydratase n=1 Tax=Devosia sp. YIM 151766 TaxID=3017325 RepID=UPI00255D076A|nr:dTDP-glucose 4,6-dehydratase [Devosia sp. YIM 151766]WIY54197.1 dTDP-glucose 4,6-dehydratase [Devosia sp. YIM 151766]
MNYLITGGAGFIGSALCRLLAGNAENRVVVLDKLTYAGSMGSLRSLKGKSNFRFVRGDIRNRSLVSSLLADENIDTIIHLAAESHVDRSIDTPALAIDTNVMGTLVLLEAALAHWRSLPPPGQQAFRFHHVSTDEVFGDLGPDDPCFTEQSPYAPSSPYAASKAAADHLVRAWHRTYGLPVVLTNCTNNHGAFQFPEKLIPITILNALQGINIPVYGTGKNVRDWLHVEDHVRALALVAKSGRPGESYNIGGEAECSNLTLVETICDVLDQRRLGGAGFSYQNLITFVTDRPGHDRRYGLDISKIKIELGWAPTYTLKTGLERTIDWYLQNSWWWRPIREKRYQGARLGLERAQSDALPNGASHVATAPILVGNRV